MGSSKPGASPAGIRVLIVDDHLFRRGLREHLEGSGVEVVGQAEDAAGAVALALETEPDVVLMEIRMPGGSGSETTKRLLGGSGCPGADADHGCRGRRGCGGDHGGRLRLRVEGRGGDEILAAIAAAADGESAYLRGSPPPDRARAGAGAAAGLRRRRRPHADGAEREVLSLIVAGRRTTRSRLSS